jgi:hypothetical protein
VSLDYIAATAHSDVGTMDLRVTGENLKAMKPTPRTTIASDGLFNPIKIPDSRSRATLIGEIGVARINDRESYQVVIERQFDTINSIVDSIVDVESGLLLRRVNVSNTMLGPLNVQWDFSDYRDVRGIKLPFLIRTSDVSSYDTVVRRFSEIKIDSSLNEDVFDIPRGPSSP